MGQLLAPSLVTNAYIFLTVCLVEEEFAAQTGRPAGVGRKRNALRELESGFVHRPLGEPGK